jgi:hypothetical protein
MHRSAILIALLFVNFGLLAQTGPGGVGNTDGSDGQPLIKLWLLPDSLGLSDNDDVLSWTDYSGNSNDLSAVSATSPVLKASAINNHDYLEFSKDNNRIIRNSFDMPSDALAVFMVLKTADSGDGVLSYAVSGNDNEYLLYQSNALTTYISGSNDNSGVSYNDDSWKIFSHQWRSSDGSLYIHLDGTEAYYTTFQAGAVITTGGNFAIGGEQDGVNSDYSTGQDYDGDIAEFIMYASPLKKAQRVVIENYLAQKYGLNSNLAAAGDKYVPDDASYIVSLTGMGKESDGVTEASCDGLHISQNGGFDNGEYIMTAHDGSENSETAINTSAEVSNCGVDSAWNRSWYIDKTTVDGVNAKIAFDFGDGINGDYPGELAHYRLLYRNTLSVGYDTIEADSKGIQNGDQIYFALSDADLTDGYYTLGSVDADKSPLTGVTGQTWYTLVSGDWDNWEVWTLDPSGSLPDNPDRQVPASVDDVVILTGKTVTVNENNITAVDLTVEGRLDFQTYTGQSFGTISGSGRILLAADNFPGGDASDFISEGEGTVEYYGNSFNLSSAREFYNLFIDMDDATQVLTLLNDYTVNGYLRINQGILQINDNSSSTDLNVTVKGEINVQSNGQIHTGTGNARHQLNAYGNFINYGYAEFTNRSSAIHNNEATDGIVDFNILSDNADQNIQCKNTTTFYRIEIDKGTDDTYELTIEADDASYFNIYGYANEGHSNTAQLTDNNNALGLVKGTVRLKSNVDVPVLNNTGNYNISEAAKLWIDGGSAAKSSGTAIVPYGKIQVTNGTLDATVSSGITIRNNGLVKVEGGTLNINQLRTSILGAENVGGYVQSGGTVNILGGNTDTDYYCFTLSYTGNVFNMSGGTLHIHEAHGKGGIFINSDEVNQNVTGGTVIMEISDSNDFPITSTSPFWNVIMRNSSGGTGEHILAEGVDVGATNENLAAQPLVVLNDLTIEEDAFLNHNGNNVTIGHDFSIDENAQTRTFDDSGLNDTYNDYNIGYLYDPAIPNTTIFNGSENGEFYIGYSNSDGFEQFFHNITVNKTAGSSITVVCDTEKTAQYQDDNNNNHWHARLPRIENELRVESGILDQGQTAFRLFGPLTVLSGAECGVWEQGTTHPWAWFMLKDAELEINTEEGAIIGNIKMNPEPQTDIITFTSDVYIKRIGYFHGRINLQTYELKLDYLIDGLTTNNYDIDDGDSSDEMFYSAGNASDGGLTLYIPSGTADGTVFPFPLGVLGKYTPAEIELSNVSDDGYITIRPVQGELQTTDLSGGDLLDSYWKVEYQGFSSNPTVDRLRFDYDNADIVGTETNYVAGKVLAEYPFTRSYEDETIPESEGVNTANNRITFNGQTDAGFTLETADYTAGETTRFAGSPEIFYVRQNGDWHNGNTWSYSRGGGAAGDYPQAGDVAVMRRTAVSYSGIVTVRQAEQAAAVIFDDENGYSSGCPRIIFDTQSDYASYGSNFSIVNVADSHEGGILDYNTHGAVIQYNIEDNYSNASTSLEFDGTDDYIAVQNYNYSTDAITEFTVEAWIKTNDAGDQVIASFDRNQYWRLEVNGNGAGNGQIGFDIMTDAGQLDFGGSTRIDDGSWHHVAGVFDNGNVYLYIDGNLDNSATSGTSFGSAGVTRYGFIGVGSEADTYDGTQGPNDFFNGSISEVRVWSTARSQAQIQASMNSVLTGSETGLDIYYKLAGNGSDNTATDDSSNGNTGDLNNFTLPGAWTSSHPWGSGFPGGDFGGFNQYPNALVIYGWDGATANADVTLSSEANEYPQMWFSDGNNSRIIRFPDTDLTIHGGFTIPQDVIVVANGNTNNTITMEQNMNLGHGSLGFGKFLFPGAGSNPVTLNVKKNINIRGDANSLLGIENASGGTEVHKIITEGDITVDASGGQIQLGDGDPAKTNVELELRGVDNKSFTNNYASSTPQFYRLIMNKGTDTTATFTLNSNFSLTGSTAGVGIAKAIELQNGKLVLNSSALNTDLTTGDDDFHIPGTAGLEIRQGTANANGGSGIILDGKLQVSGGTLDMSGGDNFIEYSASGNATIEVSSGTLTVGSQIRRGLTSTEGILNYSQSGGTVVVGNNAAPENNRGVFEILNEESIFTHTGGTLYIARAQDNASTASLYLDPANVSFGENTEIRIGHTSSPANQEIGIYSTVSIPNLIIDNASGNSPTAKMWTIPLTITDTLDIQAGTEFNANALDLILHGDMIANGTFTPNNNTSYFSGTSEQNMFGNTQFYNLTKNTNNTLKLNAEITVSNELKLQQGSFDDNGNTLNAQGDVWMGVTHTSGTSGNGIEFNGSLKQILRAESDTARFDRLTINNPGGTDSVAVHIPEGNPVVIEDELKMQKGILDIGKNLIVIKSDASINEVNAFSSNNMIQTNISFTDAGIQKYFPAISSTTNFTYPIGSAGKYTPVEFSIDNMDAGGYIRVKAADEIHPTVINDNEPCNQINDTSNVLKYHWLLEAGDITNFTADANMYFHGNDTQIDNSLSGTSYDLTSYIAARLLLNSTLWNKYDPNSFDEDNNMLVFSFTGTNDDGISGEYTAGIEDQGGTCEGAIPDQVPSYVTVSDGSWTDETIWDTYPTAGGTVPAGGPRGSITIVEHDVTIPGNYILNYKTKIDSGGVNNGILRVEETFGHRLGLVEGRGTLELKKGNLPAGIYTDFFSESGGTLEFDGSTDYDVLSEITTVNNLKFTGTGERRLPNLDLQVLGNIEIDGPIVMNEHNKTLKLKNNLSFASGSFDAGFGADAIVMMNGSSAQNISGTNSFTGSNSFFHFEIKNSAGVTINTAAEVSNNLYLTQGIISTDATNTFTLTNTDTDVVTGGSTGSFIDGPLYKNVSDGSSFTFPVGNSGRYGDLHISSTSTGTPEIWEAQYYNYDPSADGYSTGTHNTTLETVYSDGYWRIKSPSSGNAKVKIRWDGVTNVPADAGDRDELRVALWDNNTTDQWIEEDDATPDVVSGTQSSGTVETNSVHSFNEFTDGSYFAVGSDKIIQNFIWEGDVSADWNNGDNWTSGIVPSSTDNAEIPDVSPNSFPLITTAAQCNELTIQADASLTINPGYSLVLNGNLSYETGSNILLKADESARAHLITKGSITTSNGTAQVELHIRKSEYSYISMPLSNVLNNDFLNAPYAPYPQNDNLYEYNESYSGSNTNYAWNFFTTSGTAFEVGKGYAHFLDVFHTYTLSGGTFNNGNISEPIVNSANGDPANGWNLIGNPYPSAIDADAFISANSGAPFSGTLYFWDDDASKGNDYASADYATYTTVGSTSGGGGKAPNGYIAPGQGFMIEASGNGNVSFTNSMRTVQQAEFFKDNKAAEEDMQKIRLSILNNDDSLYNDILIAFTPEASYGYDKFMDGRKNFGNSNIGFYSLADDNIEYAIQALPFDRDEQVIRLGYMTTGNTSHTVKLEELKNLNELIAVYLNDKYENETIDLRTQNTYTFESAQGTFDDRFEIIFEKPEISITTWTGEASGKWNESANWDSGVPNIYTEAHIPQGSVHAVENVKAYRIVLGSNADLTFNESVAAEVIDSVILKSDGLNSARLLDFSNGKFNGKIEYFAPEKDRDYFIAKPVSRASASIFGVSAEEPGILEDYVRLFEYQNKPLRITEAAISLENLSGYIFNNYRTDHSLWFEGEINTGKITREFDSKGRYLLGNPYPSDLNWGSNDETAGWEGINILRPSLWYINRDNNTNIAAYNRFSGIGVNAGSPVIPPMSAVWVLAETEGRITVDNAAREIAHFDNKDSNNFQGVRLTVNANELSDETVVFFGPGDTGLDKYDTEKMFASATNLPQIHTISNEDEPLAINAYGAPDEYRIPVFFTSAQGGTFTVSAQVNNIDNNELIVLLEDLNTGDIIDIDNNSYTFSSAASDKENRFILHFEKDVTSRLNPDDDQVKIYGIKDNVVVNISNFSQARVSIYDLLGRPILSRKIFQTEQFRILTSGVYIVKVKTNDNVKTAKVFIE